MRFAYNHAPIDFHFSHTPRDFVVQEIPLYEFSGKGEHQIIQVRKKNLSTFELLKILSAHFGVHIKSIGYAGLKDKSATTTQFLSLPRVKNLESTFENIAKSHEIKLISSTLHDNKLKLGHLKGNRFFIRLKKITQANATRLESALSDIAREGFPNFFGFQRFGVDGDNYLLGRALGVKGSKNAGGAGGAASFESAENAGGVPLALRNAFGAGLDSGASNFSKNIPPNILQSLARNKRMRNFLISSYQSFLFNAWLEARVRLSIWRKTLDISQMREMVENLKAENLKKARESTLKNLAQDSAILQDFASRDSTILQNFGISQNQSAPNPIDSILANALDEAAILSLYQQPQRFMLLPGEICCHYPYGKFFCLESITPHDYERFGARDIAPTGALSGENLKRASQNALSVEKAFLDNILAKGSRRYAWVWASDVECAYNPQNAHFELHFTLPKGAYATSLLEQLGNRKLDSSNVRMLESAPNDYDAPE
ncbi:tRNA pseudouridine(13) synthase TruD [Helicobacter sp. CLO-3]|uniref:tRNA pseudouridine(13) synthase TruD n=1 Tax=unclassified Helicobacter TaxID=2593540 RepID=UPI00080541EE|nr:MULTISPECIES: tRNA pseudouridine(13) synthase TruD [unclassified Helicobacter]OBV29194.1 tRNA pseudouridine(13) synthase TruD [Helicobacter sp. CLO-3]OHU84025.1 tRNA pseudouridine(13) synthase TruD [Helicobacter sp. CLO-3]